MTQTLFIEAAWNKEIQLGDKLLDYFKENKITSVALFASVQFLKLDKVKEQLKQAGITVKTTKAKRTHEEIQILGCDAYADSFAEDILAESDGILYVGDGLFHPKALLLAQKEKKHIKEVLIWDPIAQQMKILRGEEIMAALKKTNANLKRYIAADSIGILVTLKPGQQYLQNAKKLKVQLQQQGKKGIIFIGNTFDITQFDNYAFIDAWVNTACPRIGMDDLVNSKKPLINIREAYDPVKALELLNKEVRS